VQKIHFRIGGVERAAVNAAAGRAANDNGRRGVPQVVALGNKVGELVETANDEIDELHFRDGA
jgi:hypothetical protein